MFLALAADAHLILRQSTRQLGITCGSLGARAGRRASASSPTAEARRIALLRWQKAKARAVPPTGEKANSGLGEPSTLDRVARHLLGPARMRRKLETTTRGFRAWTDQVDSVERMMELNSELGRSKLVRAGLDRVIAEYKGQPLAQGHRSASSAFSARRRNPARSGAPEPRPDQQAKIGPLTKLPDSAGEMVPHLIRAWMDRHKVESRSDADKKLVADLDVHYQTFLNWFHGRSRPRGLTLIALIDRLGK
jgi:hypothetical protein